MTLAEVVYDGELSGQAYLILTFMLVLIIGGLSWCIYRAISANNKSDAQQYPDEI